MVSSIVSGATQQAVDVLAELVRQPLRSDEEAHLRASAAAAAAGAWIETYPDCQHVEWFSFDPGCDPVG